MRKILLLLSLFQICVCFSQNKYEREQVISYYKEKCHCPSTFQLVSCKMTANHKATHNKTCVSIDSIFYFQNYLIFKRITHPEFPYPNQVDYNDGGITINGEYYENVYDSLIVIHHFEYDDVSYRVWYIVFDSMNLMGGIPRTKTFHTIEYGDYVKNRKTKVTYSYKISPSKINKEKPIKVQTKNLHRFIYEYEKWEDFLFDEQRICEYKQDNENHYAI